MNNFFYFFLNAQRVLLNINKMDIILYNIRILSYKLLVLVDYKKMFVESQRDHQERLKPLDYQGVLLF